MQVIKRNGQKEDVFFDKITMRIKRLAQMEPTLNSIDVILIAKKVIDGLCDNITTKQLDNLAAETAAALTTVHPEYNTLALRICVSDLHKSTSSSYEEVCEKLYYNINNKTNKHSPLITKEYYDIIKDHIDELQAMLNYQYDYDYEYFGFKALEKSYLYKANGVIIERPQHLLLRVAIGLHKDDMVKVKESYLYMAQHYFTHATPTLFNACAPNGQLSSCFLATIKDDSVDGIYDTLKQSALISKGAGGYAFAIHNVRAQNSYIHGTNGESDGIVPMLKVFNDTARYISQGGNKRKGSFANYLEPSHPDLEDWLQLKKNTGKEEQRCRDLFYGLWVPDLFMRRVENKERWSFFCPHTCPGLAEVHGEQYEQLYQQYEREGKAVKTVSAQELWFEIVKTQIETGMPYMCYKDAVNRCSNQANVGTIKSSNLCVAGDTFILTDKGQIPIKDLVDQDVVIWNGKEWSPTTVRQTGQDQNLLKITMSNGAIIECTPEHKFYLIGSMMTEAQKLKEGDELIEFDLPAAIEYGDLEPFVSPYTVPHKSSISDRLRWFENYCDADGTISQNGIDETLQCSSIKPEFLNEIRMMLQTLGVDSEVTTITLGGQPLYRLLVSSNGLYKLSNLGFAPHRLVFSGRLPQRDASQFIKIKSIEEGQQGVNTYCFTEQKRHMGMFNGVLTGQCTEIVEYTSAEEVAVCSLASIALPKFVKNGTFDHDLLYQVCYHVVGNINKAIDLNKYPVKEAEYSNLRHRPMGIGIQGLADTFILLRYPFDSKEAKLLNKEILETMYYAAIRASCDLAKVEGSYETFAGSPASKGLLQYDFWGVKPSDRWDFAGLKKDVVTHGLRNSQLISLMPTATTSSILGYNECFEPFTSNIYVRRILAGEFTMVNKYLVNDLIKLGLWNLKLKDKIVAAKGTIQDIEEIPADLKLLYRTVWELTMKDLIDMSADRGPFVCQSQSLNAWMAEPTKKKVTSMHFYAWRKGLKTGMYYLRTKTQADAIQFTVEKKEEKKVEEIVCNMEEGCVMCSG